MVATLLKVFFLYVMFLMLKNVFKGLLTYRHLKREAERFSAAQSQNSNKGDGPKGKVFEAEYRRID